MHAPPARAAILRGSARCAEHLRITLQGERLLTPKGAIMDSGSRPFGLRRNDLRQRPAPGPKRGERRLRETMGVQRRLRFPRCAPADMWYSKPHGAAAAE